MMRNERKLEILDYLSDSGSYTAGDVAVALGIEIHNARVLLRRYHHQGLLSRRGAGPFGTKEYEITKKGIERQRWLGGVHEGTQ